MQKYRCWDAIQDDDPGIYNGGTVVYLSNEADANIARLKAELVTGQRDCGALSTRLAGAELDIDLLKAALRWMANCGAIRINDVGSYFYGNTAAGNIPPQFAPLIAEAAK